jgi:arylsulfatase A-like enzyme
MRRRLVLVVPAVLITLCVLAVRLAVRPDTVRPAAGRVAPGPSRAVPRVGASPLLPLAFERARLALVEASGDAELPAERMRLFAQDECPGIARRKHMLGGELRNSFVVPDGETMRKQLVPERGQRIVFHVGVTPVDGGGGTSSEFVLRVRSLGGSESRVLATRRLPAGGKPRWHVVRADLAGLGEREVELEFVFHTSGGAAGLVSEPRLVPAVGTARPNVVLCCIETLRRDHTSLHGYGRPTTPFLEELAAEAVVFEEAYEQSSWTRPSVASLLTGLFPFQHGALVSLDGLADTALLLPEVLRESGYVTAGLFTNGLLRHPVFGYHQGFDLFVDEDELPIEQLVRDVFEWIDSESPAPFFVFMHTWDPHSSWGRTSEFTGRFAPATEAVTVGRGREDRELLLARYDESILYTDSALRTMAAGLKDRGLWDDTIMVVTSDHGEEFWEHGAHGHGNDLYPEKLGVPLVIKLPGGRLGGVRAGGLASAVDVMPTLLVQAGCSVPEGLPGVDLVAGVDRLGVSGRRRHFAEVWRARCLDAATGEYELTGAEWALIGEGHQYIVRRTWPGTAGCEESLFDLRSDPLAQKDLAGSAPETQQLLAQELDELIGPVGYTVALTGSAIDELVVLGTLRADGVVLDVRGERLEPEDHVGLAADRRSVAFRLAACGDDDALHVRTEPLDAPVVLEVTRADGKPARVPLMVGPERRPADGPRASVPAGPGPADMGFGEAVPYRAGEDTGVFLWRKGVWPELAAGGVRTDGEVIRELRDLGYL